MSKGSEHTVGKLSSNFLGTEFAVFDDGLNPSKTKNIKEKRKELSRIRYVTQQS